MESLLDTIFGNPLYVMAFILIAFVGIGVAGWYMFGNSLKALFRGAEKCPAIILKKTPKFYRKDLEVVEDQYIVDFKTRQAWFLDEIQRTPNGRLAGVVLTEDSCIPQSIGVPVVDGAIWVRCRDLKAKFPFHEQIRCALEIEKLQIEGMNAPLANWFGVMGLASILGVMVIGTIILLTSNLMPWG